MLTMARVIMILAIHLLGENRFSSSVAGDPRNMLLLYTRVSYSSQKIASLID